MPEGKQREEAHHVDDLNALLEMGDFMLRPDDPPEYVAEDDEVADVIEMATFFDQMNQLMGGSESGGD